MTDEEPEVQRGPGTACEEAAPLGLPWSGAHPWARGRQEQSLTRIIPARLHCACCCAASGEEQAAPARPGRRPMVTLLLRAVPPLHLPAALLTHKASWAPSYHPQPSELSPCQCSGCSELLSLLFAAPGVATCPAHSPALQTAAGLCSGLRVDAATQGRFPPGAPSCCLGAHVQWSLDCCGPVILSLS